MDLIFNCPFCDQELAADTTDAGTDIECPSCNKTIKIPGPEQDEVRTAQTQMAPPPSVPLPVVPPTAPPRIEKELIVPQRASGTAETLIQKAKPPLEAAAKEAAGKLHVKTIKHGDCVEVGKDKFDEIVTEFLARIGEDHLVSITPITYSHTDLATRQMLTDFAVMIIYKG
jgi:hypothetical protein